MAMTMNNLIDETKEHFQLTLLAGQSAGEHVVTWAHLLEDISAAELFLGNELVVTSGFSARDEASLLKFVTSICEKSIAGLVINTGKYVLDIPSSVIDLCNEKGMPLLTMPWNMSAMAFVRSCCVRIEKQALETERINQAAMRALQSPHNQSGYMTELSDFFDVSAGFQILTITADIPDNDRRGGVNRAALRIHTAMFHWGFQFLLFQMEQRFVLILNQNNRQITDEIATQIATVYRQRKGWAKDSLHIGIGEPVEQLPQLSKSYHTALSALRRGTLQSETIQKFSDMGFYKLLYSVPDDAILEQYYEERLQVLLEYDASHNSLFVETLFRYLLCDGSLAAVAEDMYTHRNTVHYRMGKIRDLLQNPLETQSQRFPLLLAFHIGVILGKIPDYEAEIEQKYLDKKQL